MENSFPLRSLPFWAELFPNPVLFTSSESTAPSVIGRVPSLGIPHAFAKRDATWDALVGLQLFDHPFHRAHQALRLPCQEGVRRYRQPSPALALGLTDHLWSFQEWLTSRIPLPPSWGHYRLFRLVGFLLLIPLAFSSRESLSLPDFLQPWSGAWHWPARHWRIRRQRARLLHRPGRDCQRPRLPLQRRRCGTDRHLLTRTAARDSMAGDEYATGGGGADACGEEMPHPTHGNKPTRFYVSSREKKRWHPSLLEHKELFFCTHTYTLSWPPCCWHSWSD